MEAFGETRKAGKRIKFKVWRTKAKSSKEGLNLREEALTRLEPRGRRVDFLAGLRVAKFFLGGPAHVEPRLAAWER
jgi:hypothetical protein